MKSARIVTFLLISLLLPAAGWPASSADLQAVLNQLQPEKRLRIDSRSQGRVEGKYQDHSSVHLLLQSREGLREVRLEDIERLWVPRRHTNAGILAGAAAGALALGWLGSRTDSCNGDCEDDAERLTSTGVVLGLVGGGILGGLVGTAVPHWQLRYQRQHSGPVAKENAPRR